MEPRSFDRGNRNASSFFEANTSSFNGATVFRPWKLRLRRLLARR